MALPKGVLENLTANHFAYNFNVFTFGKRGISTENLRKLFRKAGNTETKVLSLETM